MKKICITLLLCYPFSSGWCLAAEPADNQIKSALADITKYENQFAGKTSVNPSTVKRSLRLLSLTRQRLDSSPNKSHASWLEVDKRYKTLVSQLNRLLEPGSTKKSTPQSTSTRKTSTQVQTGNNAPKQMISQYRVRIKKILRDIKSRIDTLDKGGVKPFQDAAYAQSFQQSIESFRASIDKYEAFKEDPDVVSATKALTEFENMVKFGREHAAKEIAELGDVQARLRAINEQIRQLKQPPTPQEPYQKGQLGQWLRQLATVRQNASNIYKPLPTIKQRAYLPDNRFTVEQGAPYDLRDVDRLERSLITLVQSIDQELTRFGEHLKLVVKNLREGLPFYKEFDPANPSHQSKHFLSAGRADEIRAKLTQDLQTAAEAAHYAQLLKDPSYEDRRALLKEIQATLAQYEANFQRALQLVRMPKAATEDTQLTTIAKQTLANYDTVGDIIRLVINTKKQHRTKETSEDKYDNIDVSLSGTVTLSGTRTTYFYEWDQFQVATAEPVGDKHYIFYNTLKYTSVPGK